MSVEARLRELGYVLPVAPEPLGSYMPATIGGGLLFISGQLPMIEGQLSVYGSVGRDVTVDMAQQAAALAALNVLARIKQQLGGFARLQQILRVDGHVASIDSFFDQPLVIDFASRLLVHALGDRGMHARTIYCSPQLPANAPVMLTVTATISELNA